MEIRCPKCYKPNIVNGIPVMSPHSHPEASAIQAPVGIINPATGGFQQLKVDVCSKCGHVVRYYVE